jgi:DNA polymerase-3 subunit alpha
VGKDNGGGSGRNARRGVPVVLAGIVTGFRTVQTRRGRMAVITLEDGESQVEMTVFNEEFERSRPWINEDELLIVRGKASYDEYSERVRVNGDELFDFASARSHFAEQLLLRCNGGVSVEQLKSVFMPYREGPCSVKIDYRSQNAACQLQLGEIWKVTLDEVLLKELRGLLDTDNVDVIYR